MSFKVNLYDPRGQSYAPRIRHDDWERYRSIISTLHAAKTPRKTMLKRLRDDYGFTPTLGQLQAKCKEWNLKVYAKDTQCEKAVSEQPDSNRSPKVDLPPAYYLASESGFVEEWSDDYRVHPSVAISTPTSHPPSSPAWRVSSDFPDRSLPSEYIGGGLLANSADSHWPIPEDDRQCEAMLQAAHYYHAVAAFQQSFSIYRAVYLYQRRLFTICDTRLITTVLQCCCAAVTDHQRNIMHSVLNEVGSSLEIDALNPLLLDCLQSASLNMISADSSCDIDSQDLLRARANAYMQISTCIDGESPEAKPPIDLQVLLYKFEHALLMQEHETRILQKLLGWCECAVERLHHDVDDIFVGHTTCEEEYYRRISQVLSGYLLSQWFRHPFDHHDDLRQQLAQSSENPQHAIQFRSSTAQILAAAAFMVVDAIQCDPLAVQFDKPNSEPVNSWFLDAAKLFKRGTRMLCRLDERSRCALFADSFLERFYTSLSYRQKSYRWAGQLPAIVDSVGISLVQQNPWVREMDIDSSTQKPVPEDHVEFPREDFDLPIRDEQGISAIPCMPKISDDALLPGIAASPMSECNSIASFMNTYRRTLKLKYDTRSKSGRSTPGDIMSLSSSTEFRLGVITSGTSTETDSLWHVLITNESCAVVP